MDRKTSPHGLEDMSEISRRECLVSAAAMATTVMGLPSTARAAVAATADVFPDERPVSGGGFPALAMFKRGEAAKPLVLFVPGGGHLARIYYGHPGAKPEDFLFTHLSRAGFSTLALSYPTSHPSLNNAVPGMTITQWADSSAAIAAAYIAKERLPARVIALGWSLGGRVARDIAVAFRKHNIELELFVGLSAALPMPGFGSLQQSALVLTAAGLRDDSSAQSAIFKSREPHLAVCDKLNGRVVIARDAYARFYVADSPINFRGEAERYKDHALVSDIATAIADQGTFDFAGYPLCASVAAGGMLDARFALTGASAWGMINTQALYFQVVKPVLDKRELAPEKWAGVRALVNALGARLSRHVDGSHFFFVGEAGARATANYIADLAQDAAAVKSELAVLLA